MTDSPSRVYVIQARTERDYADCQAALAQVPARMTTLPFIGDESELIARTRDADALVVSFSPITRGVMSALEGLKVVVRTGVGYDVIDVPAATELGVIVVNIPDLWIREVANHALAMLLAFMVYPIVDRLTRLGLGRVLSVSVVVTMLFATLGGVFWILMIPVSIVTHWISSVTYVAALSLWALVSGHWSAWQAARVEVKQDEEAALGRVDAT